MKVRNNEAGQVLVITALSMTLLLAFLGFAIDVGLLFRAKRNAQIAADAAAVAGALDYQYNTNVTSAKAAGQAAATANGFTNGSNGVTVTINPPPVNGPEAGVAGYVEAIVTQSNQSIFMGIMGPKTVTVGARAVAGTSGPGPACIYTLGSSGIVESGSGAIDVPTCNIDDNGGITMSGSGNIIANQVNIEKSYTHSGSGTVTPSPTTFGGATDPLASLTTPTAQSPCTNYVGTVPASLSPGCYSFVLSSNATVNLQGGLYTFKGITSSGNLTFNGTGVTIFMPTGGITGSGNVGLNITAPTSGPQDGVALWLPSSNSSGITLSGNTTTSFQGIIYAPKSALTVSGSTGLTMTADLIVSNITSSGALNISNYTTVNTSTALGSGSGSGTFTMVE